MGTMNQNSTPTWSRILVKLSGEALLGGADYGIDPAVLKRIASDVGEVQALGVQIAIVIGGGNLFRGAGLARAGGIRWTRLAARLELAQQRRHEVGLRHSRRQ